MGLFRGKSAALRTQMPGPISGADRIEGAFAICGPGTQAVIWIFYHPRIRPAEDLASQDGFRPVTSCKGAGFAACGYRLRSGWGWFIWGAGSERGCQSRIGGRHALPDGNATLGPRDWMKRQPRSNRQGRVAREMGAEGDGCMSAWRTVQQRAGLVKRRGSSHLKRIAMSEKDQPGQPVAKDPGEAAGTGDKDVRKDRETLRQERLAEALRANLRRRKSAAKSRKEE